MTRMDPRQIRELGETLTFLTGDLRDWPARCGWCHSEDLVLDHQRDVLICVTCRRQTTSRVAYEDRVARAKQQVRSGVGGPILDHVEGRKGA
jgi:hypothetical protein